MNEQKEVFVVVLFFLSHLVTFASWVSFSFLNDLCTRRFRTFGAVGAAPSPPQILEDQFSTPYSNQGGHIPSPPPNFQTFLRPRHMYTCVLVCRLTENNKGKLYKNKDSTFKGRKLQEVSSLSLQLFLYLRHFYPPSLYVLYVFRVQTPENKQLQYFKR